MPTLNDSMAVLDKAVDIWHDFLDSLATIGGNIFILLLLWLLSFVGVIHVMHHKDTSDDARSLIVSTFSSLTGALMYALTQRQRGGNGNGDFKPLTPPEEPKNDASASKKEGSDVTTEPPK